MSGWGYLGGMPKVSVYLSDDLYRAAREHDLPISSLAQQALTDALATRRTDDWVARMRARAPRASAIDVSSAVAAAKDELDA